MIRKNVINRPVWFDGVPDPVSFSEPRISRVLILPFVNLSRADAGNNQPAAIDYFDHKPEMIAITPLDRLCYGVPLALFHLLLPLTNLECLFPSHFIQGAPAFRKASFSSVDELISVYPEAADAEYVVDGSFAGNIDGFRASYMVFDMKEQNIPVYAEDINDYQKISDNLIDSLNYIVNASGATTKPDKAENIQPIFEEWGIDQYIQMNYVIFDIKSICDGLSGFFPDEQSMKRILDISYSSMERNAHTYEAKIFFMAMLVYISKISPSLAKDFLDRHVDLMRNFDKYLNLSIALHRLKVA
jgi:hypothetical protein